jgi:hypothetical protein
MAKFMDLTPPDRHQLIGKLIDAMVYDDDALKQVQQLVEMFEAEGKVRSKFFPNDLNLEDENS